ANVRTGTLVIERANATEPHEEANILPSDLHRIRTAGRICGCGRTAGRRTGVGAIPVFRRAATGTSVATGAAKGVWRRRLVRRRFLRAIPAAAGAQAG